MKYFFLTVMLTVGVSSVFADELPDLPVGLEDESPALPDGLDDGLPGLPMGLDEETGSEPTLPDGLFGDTTNETIEITLVESSFKLPVQGFIETRIGTRLQTDSFEDDRNLAEVRMQLQNRGRIGKIKYRLSGDVVLDGLADTQSIDLKKGEGWLDLRELWVSGQISSSVDYKLGRQIATWGTGDFLFINDLFPKDYKSFLLGRDDEYLKAPMNSVRLSFFSKFLNLDFVYTPEFAPDRFVSGERLSYFDASTGGLVGQNAIVDPIFPKGDEFALRAHRLIGPAEVSAYYYQGYWKSPAGQDLMGEAIFPRLEVLGASWRQPVLGGIAYAEIGVYNSLDDPSGGNGRIKNSEWRWLLGFERELAKDLTGGFQIYEERMQDYGNYLGSLPPEVIAAKEVRTVLTTRLTQLAMNQNLLVSVMVFYSPSDSDFYLKPKVQYSVTDQWKVEMGGNVFGGEKDSNFYGQFENNTNIYSSFRFSF